MDFDIFTEREACSKKIEYGILRGGEKTVFLKAGRGGTYRGSGDKYLRFAEYLRQNFGASVICSSNPDMCRISSVADESVLREYASAFTKPKFYLFGYSDGGFKCIDLAERVCPERAVLANMPLMINFHKTKERLKKLGGERLAFAYGECDPSFKYLPFLYSLGGAFASLGKRGHGIEYTPAECELLAGLLFK